jgi:Zn-dependent protease with chaperone function
LLRFGYTAVVAFVTQLVPFVPLVFLVVCVALSVLRRIKESQQGLGNATYTWCRIERFQERLSVGTWFGWLVLVPLCGTHAAVFAVLRGLPATLYFSADVAFYSLPPALTTSVSWWASYSAYAQIPGPRWTARELLVRGAWGRLAWLGPLLLGSVALGAFVAGSQLFAILLVLGAYLLRRIALAGLTRSLGAVARVLTMGNLFDRAVALAARMSVHLRAIYVLPVSKLSVANAMAYLRVSEIMLTEELLQILDAREVDAVIAHELGHLRRGHGKRSLTAGEGFLWSMLFGGLYGLWIYLVAVDRDSPDPWRWVPMIIGGFAASYLWLVGMIRRRWENEADVDAVDSTGDAEALITALVKLSHLAGESVDHSPLLGFFRTHHYLSDRIRAIAGRGGVPATRVAELVRTAHPAFA